MIFRSRKRVVALVLAATMPLSSLSLANAVAQENPVVSQEGTQVDGVKSEDLSPEEQRAVEELTPQLEELFEGGMTKDSSGRYVFDYDKASQTLGKDKADEIQAEVDRMTEVEKDSAHKVVPLGTGEYTKCVLEKSGYGGLVGLFTGAYSKMIEKKLWSEVAKVIVKQIGKSAVKGGVVGVAAALTVSAGWCAWAE